MSIPLSISNCKICYQTPCFCGYKYKDWNQDQRIRLASKVLGLTHERDITTLKCITPQDHPYKEYEIL